MPLINPIYGLPNYNVDRVSEIEGKNRQQNRKKNKKDNDSGFKKNCYETDLPQSEDNQSIESTDSSQPLDTITVVRLLDDQIKLINSSENKVLRASSCYDHVKNLTPDVKVNREI